MKKLQIEEILSRVKKQASAVTKIREVLPTPPVTPSNINDNDDGEEYVPIGVKGLLAASQKLLAVNRGLDKPDDRDALMFKRILSPDKLISESIKLDAHGIRKSMLPLIARHKNLKAVGPFVFDAYTEKFLIGNPLSSPLEEINPLHLLEQSRRATQMGPGGIGTENAITEDMQMLRTDQFGFISSLEGPECFSSSTDVFTKEGWINITDINSDSLVACNINGRLEFCKPLAINKYKYEGELIQAKHNNLLMQVTPNHRIFFTTNKTTVTQGIWNYQCEEAENLFGKDIRIPSWHYPFGGEDKGMFYNVPGIGDLAFSEVSEFISLFIAYGFTSEDKDIYGFKVNAKKYDPQHLHNFACTLARLGIKYDFITRRKDKVVGIKGLKIFNSYTNNFLRNLVQDIIANRYNKFMEDALTFSYKDRLSIVSFILSNIGKELKSEYQIHILHKYLAEWLIRLIISTGASAYVKYRNDITGKFVIVMSKNEELTVMGRSKKFQAAKVYGAHWSRIPYNDFVYCPTVPGSILLVRGSENTSPYWSGNSERIGIDVRASWGSKLGSDGKLYQRFRDRKSGKIKWMNAEDLDGLTVKIPD